MTPAPLRTAGLLLRAVLGLVVLAALLAGVPYLLLAVGHQPAELADGFSLLEQDDGRLFLVVLTCLGWAGWTAFAFSAVMEIVAILRRRSAPKIKGLGSLQSLASFLVGGIVLLAPTAASAATVAPAVAVTATHTVGEADTAAGKATAVARADDSKGPRHTVAAANELPWDLAEDYLGDGKRWKDIAELNPDIPELAAGDQYLPKGAVITLPADARPITPAAAPAQDGTAQTPASVTQIGTSAGANAPAAHSSASDAKTGTANSVTVLAGDSLWSIADAHGDPEAWPAIYKANKGEPIPGGGTFTDPDKIYPGQVLDLPQTADQESPAPERTAPKPKVPASPAPDTEKPAPPAAETPTSSPSTPAPDRTTLAPADDATIAPAPQRTTPAPSTAPDTVPLADGSSATETVLAAASVAGSVLAAGAVVLMLRRRRALQRRRRGAGQNITMPDGTAAATEQALRSVDSSTELLLLDAALRTLASRHAAEGRELPPLAAVQLGAEGILLHLSDTEQEGEHPTPKAPFAAVKDRPGVWWCPADSGGLLSDAQLDGVAAPYPALVPLGDDTAGGILLVDLDEFGTLHLTGSHHLQMLRTLAISLTLSPLGQVDVASAGENTAPGLRLLDAQRVHEHQDLESAADAARAHHTEQQQLMADAGLPGMAHARLSPEADEMSPLVVLADLDTCPSPAAAARIDALLQDEPLSSTTLITSSTQPARSTADVWEIHTDSTNFPVPNTNLRCVLSMCSDDEYADILALAVTADSATGVPAPAPLPLDRLLPGAEAAGLAVPAPHEKPPAAEAKPSLLARLADLDEDLGDGTEGTPSGRGDDDGAEACQNKPEAAHQPPADPADTNGPGNTTGAEPGPTTTTDAGSDGGRNAAPVLPASASPGLVVLPAARALPQITVRLPAPHVTAHQLAEGARTPAATDTALPEIDFPADRPLISVLGAVEITGARGTVDSNRRTRATELAAFLVLHPGATAPQVDEVLSPRGGLTNPNTRNTRLRDVRRWLGTDDNGQQYFRRMTKHTDGHRLVDVECDWAQFQLLHDIALQVPRGQGQVLLRRALDLVRGRPFSGVSSTYYSWAEQIVEEINDKVTNSAALLADWCLEAGDGQGALWAAGRGLDVAREREELWRHRFRALALLGDHDGLERSIQRLETLLVDHGWAMEEETADTIRMVLATRR